MSLQHWSDDVILVDLPEKVEERDELQSVIAMLRDGHACDVVVDFSDVQVVGGAWLAKLQRIQRLAGDCGRKLTLCNVAPPIRTVFAIAHLDEVFDFAEDRFAALATPQLVG